MWIVYTRPLTETHTLAEVNRRLKSMISPGMQVYWFTNLKQYDLKASDTRQVQSCLSVIKTNESKEFSPTHRTNVDLQDSEQQGQSQQYPNYCQFAVWVWLKCLKKTKQNTYLGSRIPSYKAWKRGAWSEKVWTYSSTILLTLISSLHKIQFKGDNNISKRK